MTPDQEIQARARQLGGPGVPVIADGDLFRLPVFEEEFSGGFWEAASGHVVLRFPTFGDEVEIERIAVIHGGTLLARAQAAISVCLKAAPESWWMPGKDGDSPLPALHRLPCSPELVALWTRWMAWRDSFRPKTPSPSGEAAE